MPHAILAQVGDYSAAQGGMAGIVVKLWKALKIEIPISFQDEMCFHTSVKSAEEARQKATGMVMDNWFKEERKPT